MVARKALARPPMRSPSCGSVPIGSRPAAADRRAREFTQRFFLCELCALGGKILNERSGASNQDHKSDENLLHVRAFTGQLSVDFVADDDAVIDRAEPSGHDDSYTACVVEPSNLLR